MLTFAGGGGGKHAFPLQIVPRKLCCALLRCNDGSMALHTAAIAATAAAAAAVLFLAEFLRELPEYRCARRAQDTWVRVCQLQRLSHIYIICGYFGACTVLARATDDLHKSESLR